MSFPNRFEGFISIPEIIGGLAIFVGGIASHDHYTWWSLALVLAYIAAVFTAGVHGLYELKFKTNGQRRFEIITLKKALITFDGRAENVRKQLWIAPFMSALVVVLGVVTMSAIPCSLLKDLYVENGPLMYTTGNFFVHYWPLCRLVLFAPVTGPISGLKPLFFAINLVLVYNLCFVPNDIYGCTVLPDKLTTVMLMLIPGLLFVVWWFVVYCELPNLNT